MKKFILNKIRNEDFLDFEIVFESKVWFQNLNAKSLTYDFSNKKCYFLLNNQWELEDILDLIKNLKTSNINGLNISVAHLYQTFKNFGKAFFDQLFFEYEDKYTLKTTNNQEKILVNVVLDDLTNNPAVQLSEKISATKAFAASLQDMPPNILTARYFVQTVAARLKIYPELKIQILDKDALVKEKMNLILAVNNASHNDPYVITIKYTGDSQSKDTYAIVGKGITFDSGGYSLKDWKSMRGMKDDMSGAAIACLTMELIAQLKPKVNLIAIGCMTDNLIGGHGTVEDSIIKSMNGKTVEIANTDAEGRLVLADGVTYAIRKMNATHLVTIATLTGAVVRAIGEEFTGIFSRDESFIKSFMDASQKSFERIWRLPLTRINSLNQKYSEIADLWNEQPSSHGGASNGAGFVQEFTENKPFIHLDVAGTASNEKKLGTGVMISTFVEYFGKLNKDE